MNCSKCGNQLTDTSSPFCPFCGAAQGPESNSADSVGAPQGQTAEFPTPDNAEAGTGAETTATEEPALHPLTEKAMAGKPVDATTGPAENVPPVAPTAHNPMNIPPVNPMGANPFDAGQMPQKKRMPAWAIALIAAGIALVLAFCCCISIALLSEDFMEGFNEGFEAGRQGEIRIADPAPEFVLDEDDDFNDDTFDDATDASAAGSAAIIQEWIDDNQHYLDEMTNPALSIMGAGASVDLLASDGEFTFAYTYGADYPIDLLAETLDLVLAASSELYIVLANELARDMGLDSLTITVRYYHDGDYITSESFQSD